MNSSIVSPIRSLLVFLFAGSILVQALFPTITREMANGASEVQHLVWPFAIVGILAIAGFQVVLGSIWYLLTLSKKDTVFSQAALRTTSIIVVACGAVTVLATYPFAHMVFVAKLGGPGVLLGFLGVGTVGATITLLMLTLRTILKAAIYNRNELNEVI